MAEIGLLFMAWGRIERMLLVQSRRLSLPSSKLSAPFKNRLEDWTAAAKSRLANHWFAPEVDQLASDICSVRDARNLLGHGCAYADASFERVNEPFLKARTFVGGNQKVLRIAFSELHDTTVLAEQIPYRLKALTGTAIDPPR